MNVAEALLKAALLKWGAVFTFQHPLSLAIKKLLKNEVFC